MLKLGLPFGKIEVSFRIISIVRLNNVMLHPLGSQVRLISATENRKKKKKKCFLGKSLYNLSKAP